MLEVGEALVHGVEGAAIRKVAEIYKAIVPFAEKAAIIEVKSGISGYAFCITDGAVYLANQDYDTGKHHNTYYKNRVLKNKWFLGICFRHQNLLLLWSPSAANAANRDG
jgi:hypothetical protein